MNLNQKHSMAVYTQINYANHTKNRAHKPEYVSDKSYEKKTLLHAAINLSTSIFTAVRLFVPTNSKYKQ